MKIEMEEPMSNTDVSMEDWTELLKAVPKESDGVTAMQMPCNWCASDLVSCMVNEMNMSKSSILAILADRDLVYRILSQFQENLASHDWTDDMQDAVEHCMEDQ